MSFRISPKTITDGLVLYLDSRNTLSYTSGSTVYTDISRVKDLTYSLVNTPTFIPSNGTILFDGSNEYITSNAVLTITQEMTFDIWFNRAISMGTNNTLFAIFRPYFSFRGTNDKLFLGWFTRKTSVNSARSLISNATLSNNTWYNAVCTLTQNVTTGESVAQIYIDGVFDTFTEFSNSVDEIYQPSLTNRLLFGTLVEAGQTYFNGSFGPIKIYNKVLNSNEISQNYNTLKSRFGK